jgi:hypothetical protein
MSARETAAEQPDILLKQLVPAFVHLASACRRESLAWRGAVEHIELARLEFGQPEAFFD